MITSRELVLGVDPGITGAFALIEKTSSELISLWDMPRKQLDDGPGGLDVREMAQHLRKWQPAIRFAVIEDVSAMTYTKVHADGTREKRGQGAAASFAFGKYLGVVEGALATLAIPTFFIKPAVWKMSYGLSADKKLSLELARSLFPDFAQSFARKKDDGRAEAALIALFGAQKIAAASVASHSARPV